MTELTQTISTITSTNLPKVFAELNLTRDPLHNGFKVNMADYPSPRFTLVKKRFVEPPADAVFNAVPSIDFSQLPDGSYIQIATDDPRARYIIRKTGPDSLAIRSLNLAPDVIGFYETPASDLRADIIRQEVKGAFATIFPGQVAVGQDTVFPYFDAGFEQTGLFQRQKVLKVGSSKTWRGTPRKILVYTST